MRNLNQLNQRGQSPWYDNLSKSLIESGELAELISRGVVGVTSNPTIFDQAISTSSDYDGSLQKCKERGLSAEETYWELVCSDIVAAADVLKPIYEKSNGTDGYVSVEVSPALAHNTAETIAQANELYARISRDNVMIKIPATPEGIPAIEAVIANSIPVNVTLIFSQERYVEVVVAYKAGIAKASRIPASVASFFISRLDTKVDAQLKDNPQLQGKGAIANAALVYGLFEQMFDEEHRSKAQRPLWASTSTKNPSYSKTLYVDELISKYTVNTLPHATIDAIENSDGEFPAYDLESTITANTQIWNDIVAKTPIDAIMKELEDEGVASFEKSYKSCIKSIAARLDDM